MSGGLAYVYDERGDFSTRRCNLASVTLEPLEDDSDLLRVRTLIQRHAELTGSRRAEMILAHWTEMLPRFVKVFPHEYKRVLGQSGGTANVAVQPNPELMKQAQHG